MTGWHEADAGHGSLRVTRLGGQPSWTGTPRWPHHHGAPLPFLGQVVLPTGQAILIFMSFAEDAESWLPTGGANAALVEPDGPVPPWVEARPQPLGPVVLPERVLVPDGLPPPGAAPEWLQYDETPPDAPVLVCQLHSFPDPDGLIAFGDAGTAYLFVSEDRRTARVLWQS